MVLVFMWLPRMSDESLQTRKQEVKAANEFMVKAHSLAAESWVTKSFAAERLIRDFECDLVEHVFEKFSDDRKKLTMAEHVQAFERKLSGYKSALSASTSSTSESRNDTMFDATADDADIECSRRQATHLASFCPAFARSHRFSSRNSK